MADIEKNETKAVAKKPGKVKKFFKGFGKFFKEVKAEFKKIVWYGKKQLINSTLVVLFFILVISAVVSGLDLGFIAIRNWLAPLINF